MRKHHTLLAAALLLAGCSDSSGPSGPGPLAGLIAVGGDAQTAAVQSVLPQELVVRAVDAAGLPKAGIMVTFEMRSGGGSLSTATASTNDAGEARTRWTLGSRVAGPHEVLAWAEDLKTGARPEVLFTANATAGPVASLTEQGGNAQRAAAGSELAEDLVVRAIDAAGNPVGGLPVEFLVSSGSGTLAYRSVLTGADGEARNRWTLGRSAAVPQRVTAFTTNPASGARLEVQFTALATAAEARALAVVSGNGQSGDPGVPLMQPLRVRVTDAFSNPVAGVTVQWTAAGGGTVTPPSSVSNAEGIAETEWSLGTGAGQTVVASAAGSEVTFSAVLNPPGPLATLAVVQGSGQTGVVGQPLPLPLGVRATDAQGRPIPGLLVVFEVLSGGGSLAARTVVTGANGEARDRWTLGTSLGAEQRVRVRAVDPATGAVGEVIFSATPRGGPPARISIRAGNDQTAQPSQSLPQPLYVRVMDEFNNRLPGQLVTWTVARGGGSVTPAVSITDVNGDAHTIWTLGPSGTQAVTATAGEATASFTATVIMLPPGWEGLAAVPDPVRAATAAVLDGQIHVLGGYGNNYTRSHNIYDPATNTWRRGAPLPRAIDNAMAAVASDGLHLLGGSSADGSIDEHYIYDAANNAWIVAPRLPRPRRAGAATSIGGRIYLIGGLNAYRVVPEVDVYDVASRRWSTEAAPMPNPRFHSGVTLMRGEIIVTGGATPEHGVSGVVSAFNPQTGAWRELTPLPERRQAHAAGVISDRLCIAGGGNPRGIVFCLRRGEAVWDAVGTIPSPRFELAYATYENRLYLFGGTPDLFSVERMGPFPD